MEGRFIGIDIGKKTMVVRFLDAQRKPMKKWQGHTGSKGRAQFLSLLNKEDYIGIEAGALTFILAREIEREIGATVYVLNPGRLHMIFKSVRKTDSEDAMKIARFIASNPEEALPTVSIPTEEEEESRAIVSELMFSKQSRTRLINRLHSIFVRSGITDVAKKSLKTKENREKETKRLFDYKLAEAERLLLHIDQLEADISVLEQKEAETLDEFDEAKYLLSIPGVAVKTALAFVAHIGVGDRFSSGSQVSNYVGFVPRLDISGDQVIYGRIHKRGNSSLRALYVQSAWALVRSNYNGALKQKYLELVPRKGKKKAIVAIARKMLELSWTLTQKKEMYCDTSNEALVKKLKYYKLKKLAKTA